MVKGDPARWPKRWSLPRQTWIDVCAASTSVLRRDPPQEPAKEQSGAERKELASVKKTIWTCVPQKFVGKPLYTWSLSLSWQLHIWTRGTHPAVHVPSSGASLTWALLRTLLWLSYFMHDTTQCIVNLERDLFWIGELGCLRTHLPCGLAGRLHDLHHLFHRVCSSKPSPDLILWPAGKCLSAFISGDVLVSAISNHLVAWVYIWRLHL